MIESWWQLSCVIISVAVALGIILTSIPIRPRNVILPEEKDDDE